MQVDRKQPSELKLLKRGQIPTEKKKWRKC